MNTYYKFAANVFVAKCTEAHEKWSVISVTSKHGIDKNYIVFNLVGKDRDGNFYYSIVREDGFNSQEYAKNKAEKLESYSLNAIKKSNEYQQAATEGSNFLSLGEPIKIGHHSESKHRNLIERNNNRMEKCIEFQEKAGSYDSRIEFWKSKENVINLSMPESLEFYAFKLDEAKKYHADLKNGIIQKLHSFSLSYANKAVKDAEKNLSIAQKLWG